jgi:GalNAc-alpha-(1->4)-GalNAc-alpha-(1->3)-diNAcBac-PP-undecaprenol alpha-1,4-N-acetyl-D-galactosaminyltransferase
MDINRIKLCLVIPSLQTGGMERVMSELANYFCTIRNIETHLVLYGLRPKISFFLTKNLIIHTPQKKYNNKMKLWFLLKRFFYLRATIKKINPYCLLSFGEVWNSFVILSLFGLPCKIYISDRCSPEKKFTFLHSKLRRILYPLTSGVIAQTEKARQAYKAQFKHENVIVIGNPIRQIMDLNKSTERKNIIITVGRLIESKHHDRLIELFAKLPAPDWELIIVGDDALNQKNHKKLEVLIKDLNQDHRIFLAGNQVDVDSYLMRSKIFVFTSSSEGFPNVIGEAMAAELPVISFNCVAGPSEMILNGINGFLIPTNDYASLYKRLKELIHDQSLRKRLGTNARKSIRKFSIENIGSKYYEFIMS